jgi:Acetyltransferases
MRYDYCVKLWMEIFGDSEDFIRRFYDSFGGDVFTEYDGDTLIGMVNRVPIRYGRHDGGYIYAACTRPEYRGCGIFRRLITEAETGMDFMMLIPAEPDLYAMYRKLGYNGTGYSVYPYESTASGTFTTPFDGDFHKLYRIYLTNCGETDFIKPYDIFVLSLHGFEINYSDDGGGFMIYETKGKNIIKIYDMYCKNYVLCDTINAHESGVYKIIDDSVVMPEKMKVNLFMEV